MANIRTTFTLVDNASSTILKINDNLTMTINKFKAIAEVTAMFYGLKRAISSVADSVNELTDAYADQYENEVKLYTIMRQRMSATLDEFNSIRALASEMEKYGVLSDKVILKGAQELASFVETEDQLKRLLPAIADLTVQQNGYNASANQMRQITTSIGKMLNGTVSGLSKLGLAFTDAEKKMLKSNDMAKKVEIVYKRIVEKVGDMNVAMGLTNVGKIQNLKNQIEGVNEELGKMLQPLRIAGLQLKLSFQTRALEVLGKAMQWVRKHIDGITAGIVLLTRALTIFAAIAIASFASMHPYLMLIGGIIGVIAGLADKLGFGFGLDSPFAGGIKKFLDTATTGFEEGWPEVETKNGAMLVHDDELISIAEDYRDLLSKRAVERFNLQLARISPSITIEKVDVHKEADATNVLDVVVNAIEDFSNSSLSTTRGR